MALSHSIRAVGLVAATALAAGAQTPSSAAGTAKYTVFLRGSQIGTEEIAVVRNADGWTVSSNGRIGPPLDLTTRNLQIQYDAEWKGRALTLDATAGAQLFGLRISVAGTTATTHVDNAGQAVDRTDTVAADVVLLPNPFFAAYAAIAARLKTASPGAIIPAYQGGPIPISVVVGDSGPDRIQTVARLIEARRTHVTLAATGQPGVEADVWGDEAGRLLRVSVPAQSIDFVRDDIASVSTRRVAISRAGDEPARIPANGFNLIGTITKPAGAAGKRLPALVLVGGSGPIDRDGTVADIPVYGQLANALADAGYLVLRYDKRGVGQSGGRIETAGFAEYAEDLRAAVKFVADRKDVDAKRIAVAGHSEGGAIALVAAAKDKRIAALVLLAAPGVPGSDLVLAQQKRLLDRSGLSDADKQARIDLQKQIHEAVITGKGVEALPASVRRQVDNAEFSSILTHDPAKILPKVRQPILIVQGSLDTQVEPSNAEHLAELARGRKDAAPAEVVSIPGVNHLMVPATTGEVDEYPALKDKRISALVASSIVAWLQKAWPASGR
ncbi:MAG: alpha/beta fold hydrolase [Acidobacteriota bacterium]